jgi:hypothetical protein
VQHSLIQAQTARQQCQVHMQALTRYVWLVVISNPSQYMDEFIEAQYSWCICLASCHLRYEVCIAELLKVHVFYMLLSV